MNYTNISENSTSYLPLSTGFAKASLQRRLLLIWSIIYTHVSITTTIVILVDLSKAFDCLNIDKLCNKLEAYGIRGTVNNWFRSFLTDRSFKVSVDNALSAEHRLLYGVPQGSILSPRLFSLYVNDLSKYLQGEKIIQYADDTTIILSSPSQTLLFEKVTKSLDLLDQYCKTNNLTLNRSKTVFLNPRINKPLNNDFLYPLNFEFSDSAKFLGLNLDPKLHWSKHIDHICSRLNQAFFALLNLKHFMDRSSLLAVYHALGVSHIQYGILCWGSSSEVSRVFVLQKKLIRLIFKLGKLESCRPTFLNERIMTVPGLYIFKLLVFVKKNYSLFSKLSENHSYKTRNYSTLMIPDHNTETFKLSPYFRGVKFFNTLPVQLRKISEMKDFKKAVKNFILDACYYSVEDFLKSN